MADDEEARRHVLDHLGNIFAQLTQLSVAARALGVLGKMSSNFTRQMCWKSATLVLCARRLLRTHLLLLGLHWLLSFDHASTQAECELILVERCLLRLRSELRTPE